jgi:tubulin alpha
MNLFTDEQFIIGRRATQNNFARGRYGLGTFFKRVQDRIKNEADQCSVLPGILIFHSLGGGTGSGFTSLLMGWLSREYPGSPKLQFVICADQQVSSAVGTFNQILHISSTLSYSDCILMFDNDAIYDICQCNWNMQGRNYGEGNRLIRQIVSSITGTIRYDMGVKLADIVNNLTPDPRLHFPLVFYTPIISAENAQLEQSSVTGITMACFERGNQMVKCDPQRGTYMGCSLLYQGDIKPDHINASFYALGNTHALGFVDYKKICSQTSVNHRPPTVEYYLPNLKSAVCTVSNSTAINDTWNSLISNFDGLYNGPASIHQYLNEGMEADQFIEAREGLAALRQGYEDAAKEHEPVSQCKYI